MNELKKKLITYINKLIT